MCPNIDVKSIFYIAAVIPKPGEKPFKLLSKEDEKHYFSGISYDEEKSALVISGQEKLLNAFAQDADNQERKIILESATSEPSLIAEGVVNYDFEKWHKVDKYYVFTQRDIVIALESQKKITKQFAFKSSLELDSGNLPIITRKKELANFILRHN